MSLETISRCRMTQKIKKYSDLGRYICWKQRDVAKWSESTKCICIKFPWRLNKGNEDIKFINEVTLKNRKLLLVGLFPDDWNLRIKLWLRKPCFYEGSSWLMTSILKNLNHPCILETAFYFLVKWTKKKEIKETSQWLCYYVRAK